MISSQLTFKETTMLPANGSINRLVFSGILSIIKSNKEDFPPAHFKKDLNLHFFCKKDI
jgi:hypothetical protein